MPDQVRCPNCGGYRVSMGREFVMRGGKKKVVSLSVGDYVAGVITLGLLLVLAVASNNAVKRANPPVHREHTCYVCGYQWASGDAPPSTASPDLLKMGAEQRRREEAAAAAAYLQQRSSDRDRDRQA